MYRILACLILDLLLVSLVQAQPAMSIEARLTGLEDRESIRTLLHSYGRYVDERNWQAFSELFAVDSGTWDGGMGIAAGRAAIIEMMESTIGSDNNIGANGQGVSNLHLISNEFIEVQGDTATALSKWVFVMTAEEGGPDVVFVGHYDDQLVKENGHWKFLYRKVSGDIMQNLELDGL